MRILRLLCPWALSWSRLRKIFPISLTEYVIVDKRLSVKVSWTCWRFAMISNKGTLSRKETIEKFGFFFKVCYETIFLISWGIKIFLVATKKFGVFLGIIWFIRYAIVISVILEDSMEPLRHSWRLSRWRFRSKLQLFLPKLLNTVYLAWIIVFILLLYHGESLSLQTVVLWRTKLLIIMSTVLLEIPFSLTLVFKKLCAN